MFARMRQISRATVGPAVRLVRRVRGGAQLRSVEVTGDAPRQVVSALRQATFGRPSAEERGWIRRIEQLRSLLSSSPDVLEIDDFGAGPRHAFDTGTLDTVHHVTRTLGQMTASSKPPAWAYLLLRLVRELRPASLIELGSCVGISACYQAAALELNGTGRLVTLEGAAVLAGRSQRSIEELGLTHRARVRAGRFADILPDVVTEYAPVDIAFIDGHHVEQATLDYAEQILAGISDEALIIFDDIHWSSGMENAWRTFVEDQRFALTIEMRQLGLAVVSRSATSRHNLSVSYA